MVLKDIERANSHDPLDRLIEELESDDATTRWKAAKKIGRLNPSVAAPFVPRLIEALGDKSIVVRVSAAEALGRIDPSNAEVIPALIRALRDKYATVREAVAMALGNVGGGSLPAVAALREALTDESKYVSKEVAGALARIISTFTSPSLPMLMSALSDSLPSRQAAAAFVLGGMGESAHSALEFLSQLRNDPEPEVSRVAAETINKLTFEDSGSSSPRPTEERASKGQESPLAESDLSRSSGDESRSTSKDSASGSDESGFASSFVTRDNTSPNIVGLEAGKSYKPSRWQIPTSLNCGSLGRGLRYERLLRISVPVPCRLTSESNAVTIDNGQLARGPQQVLLTFEPIKEEGPFQTRLKVSTPSIERTIEVTFIVVSSPTIGHSPAPHRSIIWQPSNWTKLTSTTPRAGAIVTSETATSSSVELDAWNDGSDSSESTPALIDFSRGSLPSGHTITPYSPAPVIRSTPYQTYRARSKPAQQHFDSHRSRFLWLGVISVGLIAAVVAFALRFVSKPEISMGPVVTKPELTEPTKPKVDREPSRLPESKFRPIQKPKWSRFRAKTVEMEFSLIQPNASFLMGRVKKDDRDDENPKNRFEETKDNKVGPEHLVRLTHTYYIGCYEVTRRQWNVIMSPAYPRDGDDNLPVDRVSWFDAVEFCNRLSEREKLAPYYEIRNDVVNITDSAGAGYRLPTEAEWEYASRAGKSDDWFFGDNSNKLTDYAYFGSAPDPDSGETSHPVGEKLPNPFGLYDIYGNVAEWCWDWHDDYELMKNDPSGPLRPKTPKASWSRILRGGDFGNPDSIANSYYRSFARPDMHSAYYGFRVARNLLLDELKLMIKP